MVSWVVGVAAWVSCVVRPLDRPCDDELAALLGSVLCSVVGAVLCVVGVECTPDTELVDAPVAVLCVVGVLCGVTVWCTPDGAPFDVASVPCGVGVGECDGCNVVPVCGLWPETAPDDGEPPRSACGAAG